MGSRPTVHIIKSMTMGWLPKVQTFCAVSVAAQPPSHAFSMAVKVGKKYPATIFEYRNYFLMCRNFFSSRRNFLAGSKRVQVSQQGRLIPGRRHLLPAHLSSLIFAPLHHTLLLARLVYAVLDPESGESLVLQFSHAQLTMYANSRHLLELV